MRLPRLSTQMNSAMSSAMNSAFPMNLASLRGVLLRQLAGMGAAGIIGITLGVFALAFAWSGNRELNQQIAEVSQQRAALAHTLAHGVTSGPAPREQLAQFQAGLPPRSALPDILLQLDASAREHGLSPQRADLVEVRGGAQATTPSDSSAPAGASPQNWQRLRITLPLKGSYTALRGWLSAARTEIPGLAIDTLDLQRQKIGDEQLDARVQLIVYLRRQP